jgi:type IV secretion system protein VirD4
MKTGTHPMQTKLKLFLDWGITFDKTYETEERSHRKVYYADKEELEENILNAVSDTKSTAPTSEPKENSNAYGGMDHTPMTEQEMTEQKSKTKFRP